MAEPAVTCPQCGGANPAAAHFCGACGARLELVCAACRSANPPGNRFCHRCGGVLERDVAAGQFVSPRAYTPKHLAEKILALGSTLAGERKQVTVLFVDVSGFTSLSERLDPEEVHTLMSRAFELMLAEVHRYEGTVNQFLGDGIMALFGAPIAHEDHARRAVNAALGIRRVLAAYQDELAPRGITFRARQGLNTGLVVVGSIGGDLRMDYTAVGDTTNVAARLQQVGEPGRVTIAEATYRLVRGYFDTRPLGQIHVKGKTEPISAWDVVAARETRTRLEVEADRGLTPFVARERELRLLLDAFARARAGRGEVVLISGDAGIGKSRLLLEFRRQIGDDGIWHEGHCVSFGRTMTLHPVIDLVRRQFRIDEGDDDGAVTAKLGRGLADIDPQLASALPYLCALLSVDPGDAEVRAMSPAQRRAETFEALRRVLACAAGAKPQVLVIEDLHWMDEASEQFLAALVDTVPAIPALLVFTHRPGYAAPFGDRSYVTRIVPAALSADDTARVAAAVLAAESLPDDLRRLIAAKADGNPFYVEELVKSLEETGSVRRVGNRYELTKPATEIPTPETIQDLIAARIDRLDDAPKRTLQLAAVIGREFTRRLIDRLTEIRERSGELLRTLTALELIYERRVFPELAYMFNHALTHDVAYESLLVQRRKELHRLVGLAVEELYADRLPEHYEMLAHHFSRAEEWARALDYLLKAADKATHAFGLRQALALYDDALVAAGRLGDGVPITTLLEIRRARADLFFAIGDFECSRAEGESAAELARRLPDRAAEAGALTQVASALQWAENFPAAHEKVRRAVEIAQSVGAEDALAGALYIRGYLNAVNGQLDAAEVDIQRAVQIGRAIGDVNREALALHLLAMRHAWQGRYRQSLELGTQGADLARRHRLVVPLLRCLWNEGMAQVDMGDYDAALARLAEGLALAEKIGDDAFVPRFLNTIGWLRINCGDIDEGVALSERSCEITSRSSRAGHGTGAERRAFVRNNEADAWMARGDLGRAADALDEAHHIVQHPPPSRWMTWRYTMHCYASLAQLALLRGDPERARRLAAHSLEGATSTSSRKFESAAWRIKGESATARRAWDEAADALRTSLAIAEEIRQPRETWLSQRAVGHLHAARGRKDDARANYRAALATINALRERTREPALRAGLASLPMVRELEDLARE